MQIKTVIIVSAIAASGAGLWTYAGSALAENKALDYTPNPLGIKMSPYGQVIAMAIQAPIDNDWHVSQGQQHHVHGPECAEGGCNHDHHAAHDHSNHEDCSHDHHASHDHDGHDCGHEGCSHDHHASHGHDDHDCDHEGCSHGHHASHDDHDCDHEGCSHDHAKPAAPRRSLLARLNEAVSERTNPRPPSPAHAFYLRREVEKRLYFAWSLDPSHYSNYHAYHLFLSISSIGTREALQENWTQHGINVARFTIEYSLREQNDPRPALTAAVAAANALELMFDQKETRPLAEFQQTLAILDHALARHVELSNAWVESGAWANLSPMRQQEVSDRYTFLCKIREANAEAVQRIADFGLRNADSQTSESRETARNTHSSIDH